MLRPLLLSMSLGLFASLPLTAGAQEFRQITVVGTGEASAVPDMATIRFGVVSVQPTAGDAMAAMSEAMSSVMAALDSAGVAERDVQTSGLDLYPIRNAPKPNQSGEPAITGFEARISVSVLSRDIPALGGLLDAVVSVGANQMQGLTFGVQDPEAQLAQARKAAVADALAKAALYADAAGVTLGPVHSIVEQGANPRPEMMARAMSMSDAGPPIAGGEVSLTAQVTVVIALQD